MEPLNEGMEDNNLTKVEEVINIQFIITLIIL